MTSDFLGVGWQFPIQLSENKTIALATDEASIRQAMWMILSTAPGERPMRPEFGCGIHDLVFAPNAAGTAGQLSIEVKQALTRWEPRIDVLNVEVSTDPQEASRVLLEINYRVRRTNNRFNLVYPFYLEY